MHSRCEVRCGHVNTVNKYVYSYAHKCRFRFGIFHDTTCKCEGTHAYILQAYKRSVSVDVCAYLCLHLCIYACMHACMHVNFVKWRRFRNLQRERNTRTPFRRLVSQTAQGLLAGTCKSQRVCPCMFQVPKTRMMFHIPLCFCGLGTRVEEGNQPQ